MKSKDKDQRTLDYEVGYRKPPKEHRFKKGTSGNARGRPKGSGNGRTVLKRVLTGSLNISAHGKSRRVTVHEAMLWKMAEKALKGDVRAADLILKKAAALESEIPQTCEREPQGDAERYSMLIKKFPFPG